MSLVYHRNCTQNKLGSPSVWNLSLDLTAKRGPTRSCGRHRSRESVWIFAQPIVNVKNSPISLLCKDCHCVRRCWVLKGCLHTFVFHFSLTIFRQVRRATSASLLNGFCHSDGLSSPILFYSPVFFSCEPLVPPCDHLPLNSRSLYMQALARASERNSSATFFKLCEVMIPSC